MKNQCGDDLPLSYWVSLVRKDARHYLLRLHNPAAFVRSLWLTLVHRDNVERCNDCGRSFDSWAAPDELYERVKGNRGGQFCHECFAGRAEAKGIRLIWHPVERVDNDTLRALFDDIGAFQ